MKQEFFDYLHSRISQSKVAMWFVRKLHNQLLRCIQKKHGPSTKIHSNGELWLIRQVCSSRRHNQEGRVVFDIGANAGHWANAVRTECTVATIHCFECNPCLIKNLSERFRDDQKIIVNNEAMGSSVEFRQFLEDDQSSELGHLAYVDVETKRPTSIVKVATVDEYCVENGITHIDLVKIDTEGNDFACLKGARKMLDNQCIEIVQWEYGEGWQQAGATLYHCIAWMNARGYTTFLLTPGGLQPYDVKNYGDFFGYANFVSLSEFAFNSVPQLVSPDSVSDSLVP